MKNDRKIILFLFSLEIVMLAILTTVASFRSQPFKLSKPEMQEEKGMLHSVGATREDLFPDSLYLNYFTSQFETTVPDAPESLYNYYTFSFSADGVHTQLYDDDKELTSGITSSTLSDSQLTIRASRNASNPTILSYGNLYIQNPYVRSDLSLREILSEPLTLKKLTKQESTSVVLYHTHTMESYCRTEEDRYRVSNAYNETTDNTRNVVTAADRICETLLAGNIAAQHDITIHREGRVNGVWQDCYYFGVQTLTSLLEANKETQLVLDVHRDGVTNPNTDTIRYKSTVTGEDGTEYAQIMLVVGLNYNASYEKADEYNPYWKENFKLALLVIEKLEERVPGITRGISLRREAYNQHLAPNTLLVEMGFDGNLVSEAEASSKLLGSVLAEIYS